MIVLSIDTTCKVASCALTNNNELIEQITLVSEKTHSETILSEIDKLFIKANMKIGDVDLFAVTVGPGSFTGVRVGVSLVKGLAFNKNIPCVGVSTLSCLSENLSFLDGHYIISPVMDARRNQLYNAVFELKDHRLFRLTCDRLIQKEDLLFELKNFDLPVCFVGDGHKIMEEIFDNIVDIDEKYKLNDAYSVAKVALNEYINEIDKSKFSDLLLKPVYLRASQAERELNNKGDN